MFLEGSRARRLNPPGEIGEDFLGCVSLDGCWRMTRQRHREEVGKGISGPGNSMGACMKGLEMAGNPDALAPRYSPHI